MTDKADRTIESYQSRSQRFVEWTETEGIEAVDVGDVWMEASEYVLQYNPALGDSFALAVAEDVEATLLVGDDYDEIADVSIERFREGSA